MLTSENLREASAWTLLINFECVYRSLKCFMRSKHSVAPAAAMMIPQCPCMRQDAIGNAKKAAKQPTPSVSELRRGISFHDGAEPLTTTSVTSSKSAKELAWQDISWSRARDCLASM